MEAMQCPECGSTEFQRDEPQVVRVTLYATRLSNGSVWFDDSDDQPEVLDSDRDGVITCADCGWEVEEDELSNGENEEDDNDE